MSDRHPGELDADPYWSCYTLRRCVECDSDLPSWLDAEQRRCDYCQREEATES